MHAHTLLDAHCVPAHKHGVSCTTSRVASCAGPSPANSLPPHTSQPASDMQPKGCRSPGMIPYLRGLHFRTYVISQHLLCKSLVKKPELQLQLLQARELMRTDEN